MVGAYESLAVVYVQVLWRDKMYDVDSFEFKTKHPDARIVNEKAFRSMIMRNCHSKQQCMEFYEREGIEFIKYMGEHKGYHEFREYYEGAFKGLNK
jgi:hypothetical protein